MNPRIITTLLIGCAAGSVATILGGLLAVAFATVSVTASFAAALTAFACTLFAVVVTGVMGTLCSTYIMRASAELADVADITTSS
jgi:uncharacterized membrane protein